MAFSDQDESDSNDDDVEEEPGKQNSDKYKQRKRDEKKPHTQIKHVFDINVRQL